MPAKRRREGHRNRRRCLRACETCKRRKERCDGRQPCRRCVARGVDSDCKISYPPLIMESLFPSPESDPDNSSGSVQEISAGSLPCGRPFPQLPALAKDERGTYMYIGDAATLSFLHNARRIVHSVLGPCDFVDDPLRQQQHTEEASHGASNGLVAQDVTNPPPKPTLEDTKYLIHWFILGTNSLLNIIDQKELRLGMPDWCQRPRVDPGGSSAIYYLILALGAQSCPEDKDEIAESYFNHGRYITLTVFMEDPSLVTIQCHVLITMYFLAGSRRNSAFMYLGTAVRAAYALGLHKQDVSALYPPSEYSTRERLWRAIRILDLFMSASLGRPPSTTETRDTIANSNYSAANDLCFIFENILTHIYAKRKVSKEALTWITHLHRQWASHFTQGLKTDGIPSSEDLETDRGTIPNIGLILLKEAYYWTVMLLTQPILIEKVSSHASSTSTSSTTTTTTPSGEASLLHASNDILATACVDSATRTSNLLASFISSEHVPKRIPLMSNSAFLSALVIGLAIFGDMDQTMPLRRSLEDARMSLAKFSPHDPMTNNHLAIVDKFKAACDKYVEIRTRRNMDRQSRLVSGVFGNLHADSNTHIDPSDFNNPCSDDNYATYLRPDQVQGQDQLSLNDLAPTTDSSPHFQSDIPFSNMPGSDYIGIDANTIIRPLSLDCYDMEWPLVSTVENV